MKGGVGGVKKWKSKKFLPDKHQAPTTYMSATILNKSHKLKPYIILAYFYNMVTSCI
jgi:hypothetical protein